MKYPAFLLRVVVHLLFFCTAIASTSNAQTAAPHPAIAIEPIAAILEAFRSHQVVALGEGHGNEQGEVFRLSLIRDPRFPALVNDIVVESGNALYQDTMDQFIRGEDVPYTALRQAWQNTTAAWAWDTPNYEGFFRAVRSVNASLPRERQLRVLLGDPPIDWNAVKSADDYRSFFKERDTYPAKVIRREVLAKNRRALVIYGLGHLMRKYPPASDPSNPTLKSIVALLEESPGTRVFSIYPILRLSGDVTTIQPNVASWPNPSLAILRGTVLGAQRVAFYVPALPPDFRAGDPGFGSVPMEDEYDAVLYLGPPSRMTLAALPPSLCADSTYIKMHMDRSALVGSSAEALKQLCATQVPK
jgi:hypothetical protein